MALSVLRSLGHRRAPILWASSHLTELGRSYWQGVGANVRSGAQMLYKRFMGKKCPCGLRDCTRKEKAKNDCCKKSKKNKKSKRKSKSKGKGKGKAGAACGGNEGKKEDNLAAVLYGKNDLRLEQRPKPKPKYGEVLLAMDTVGVCGSDLQYMTHGRMGGYVLKKPMIIGHEASGIVAKVGKGVKHLKEGDRCAIEPTICCRVCDFCRTGRYNLCPRIRFCATPPHDGILTQYYKHAADFCYKLPDHVTMEEGALLEPLSMGVAGCRRARIKLGSHVLILGAGSIGLMTLIAAKAQGAASVTIIDLNEPRLLMAKELGATHAVKMCKKPNARRVVKELEGIIGAIPDKTIDCVGTKKSIKLAAFNTRSGGKCVIVGMSGKKLKLPMEVMMRQVDILGAFHSCNDYKAAISLIASDKAKVKKLVTHHFDIKDTKKAYKTVQTNKGNPIKVLIHVQKRDKNNKEPFKK